MPLSGIYGKRFTQEDASFFGPFMGQDLCQKLVGTKRGLQIYELSNDKLYCHWTFEASPELNCSNMLSEGQTSTVTMPIMGGLCAVFCKKTSKGYDFVVESDKIGRMEVSCEFSSEGMKRLCKRDGKAHEEKWIRVIQVDGHYKCTKQVRVQEFMKRLGLTDEILRTFDHYNFWIKCTDKGLKMTECFGDLGKVHINAHFDEEFHYKFPKNAGPAAKVVFTKVGNGKYCCVANDEAGNCVEWTYTFHGNEAKMSGRNLISGETCEMQFIKEKCPIAGTWNLMKICGAEELLGAIGLPIDQACKIAKDTNAKLVVEEKGNCIRWCLKSQVSPMDFTFKWCEEFQFYHPFLKEKVKSLFTKEDNGIMVCTKSSHGNWLMKCTIGDCFMVTKCFLDGLECMPITQVFCREC